MDRGVTLNEIALQLDKLLPNLPASKKDFAKDLVKQQLGGKKKLSEKQAFWLQKLHTLAVSPPPPPQEIDVGVSLLPIVEMFKNVGKVLKYPKIDMDVADNPIRLHPAASYGKNAGSIYITNGKYDAERRYYGRITPNGKWLPHQAAEEVPILDDLLPALAANPAETAAEYGKKSGRCCFCNRPLTHDGSTHVGYGPICASRWGLFYPTAKQLKEIKSAEAS